MEIRNTRQISVVSIEELATIAKAMEIEQLCPSYLGANLAIKGIPQLTLLPPGSRLQFTAGATIVVDAENHPCLYPAREIEADFPGSGHRFKPAAASRRGFTAWVERAGAVEVGDRVRLFLPAQPGWSAGAV